MFKKTDDVRCENCVFFTQVATEDGGYGKCRRMPPFAKAGQRAGSYVTVFEKMWCGEFQHREPQGEEPDLDMGVSDIPTIDEKPDGWRWSV